MGKVTGIMGQASGKVGNVVFRVTNGIQVATAYQPIVANPKTKGQVDQRKKMTLAGRISKLVDKESILGLGGGNARARRGRFLSLIARSAVISGEVAKINPAAIRFSEGDELRRTEGGALAIADGTTTGEVIVTVGARTLVTGQTLAGYRERYVCLLIDPNTSVADYGDVRIAEDLSQVRFRFVVEDPEVLYTAVVYCIPEVQVTRSSRNEYTPLGYDEGIVVGAGTQVFNMMAYGLSEFMGAVEKPVSGREVSGAKKVASKDSK